jgi:hypothetical protein
MAELANSQEAGKFSPNAGGNSSGIGIDPSQPEQSANRSAKMETGIPSIDLGSVEIKFLRILFSHMCCTASLTLDESEGSISSTMTEQGTFRSFETNPVIDHRFRGGRILSGHRQQCNHVPSCCQISAAVFCACLPKLHSKYRP